LSLHSCAYSDKSVSHYQEVIKTIGIVRKNVVEAVYLHTQTGRPETKEDYSGMWASKPKHELTEVAIIGNKHALFSVSNGKNFRVR